MKGYCKWCDKLTNSIVKVFDNDWILIWNGCIDCYEKRPKGVKKEMEDGE